MSLLRICVHIVLAILTTSLARVFRGPKRPTWSYTYEALIAFLRRYNLSPPGDLNELRKWFDSSGQSKKTKRKMDVEEVTCDGVKALWVRPKATKATKDAQDAQDAKPTKPARVILYCHGGAYVQGSTVSHMGWTGMLASHNQLPVLSVDYRRAPEHPCPAAIEDCVKVYKWLLQRTPAEDIILAGDSAGGGLALTVMFALRADGLPLPGQAMLFSPWVDLTMSMYKAEGLPYCDYLYVPGLRRSAKAYAGDLPLDDHRLSPLFGDLKGLPPMLLQVGERELFVKEGKALAYKAQEAGVEVALVIGKDDIHVYPSFGSLSPEGLNAMKQIGEFLTGGVDAVSDTALIEDPTPPPPPKDDEDDEDDW